MLVFDCNVIQLAIIYAWPKISIFFPHNKETGPYRRRGQGDDSSREDSRIYFSMATHSGADRLYGRVVGRRDPGRKYITQSYGLLGGSERAFCLLNTSCKSWCSDGMEVRSGAVPFMVRGFTGLCGQVEMRQFE